MRYAVRVLKFLAEAKAAKAHVAIIYIQEAHAVDEWPISSCFMSRVGRPLPAEGWEEAEEELCGGTVSIPQHTSMAARIAAASDFVRDNGVRESLVVVADMLDNGFQNLYASWPIRWFILSAAGAGGAVIVERIGAPEDASFDFGEVADLLDELPDM